ncbi:multicomponent Na+:H+ antiporter subunit E [Halovenus aranensis]|jgi:multicomponent Na+:H+ antiporter subunit E|uniref:Multicomponent Na+:H+ antiporter subunit E n=1 Tax=Halovenus aranensis TaxID=890420 RepID=A0A1G8U2J8_9EURY|nr:Na+/H+ antiporter subunit E [Halovenus aranensis]SDJ48002.1 multicomponent Na+:H+ antiporter subunit E [Halovenus aranensis]
MKIRRWLAAGLLFAGVWVFVEGPALRPRSVLATFIIGLAVGLPLAYVFRRLYSETVKVGGILIALPYSLLYISYFLKEVVIANIDVAYRVLAPNMPLRPQVILVPLRVETEVGITTISNSITITPGTITLDHDPEENALYVHAIDGRHPEEIVEPIRQWEDYALVIFDEEAAPSEPAPEITVHPPGHPPEPKTVPEGGLTEIDRDDQGEDTDD